MNQSSSSSPASFGIATAPQQVSYYDILRLWKEADAIPQIEHAWLFDHLLPIGGDPNGPIFEGWTLLSALAAQTEHLRLGLLVTSNRFRPPAVLSKIAATVDIVADGRLDFGIGVGSRPNPPTARRECPAHGLRARTTRSADSACSLGLSGFRFGAPGTSSGRPMEPRTSTSSSCGSIGSVAPTDLVLGAIA